MSKLYNTIYTINPMYVSGAIPRDEFTTKILNYNTAKDGVPFNYEYSTNVQNSLFLYEKPTAIELVQEYILQNIDASQMVLLYIHNKPLESMAQMEVVLADSLDKPIYIIINTDGIGPACEDPFTNTDEDFRIEPGASIYESYFLLMGLPNVHEMYVNSEEEARLATKKIVSLESPIEEIFFQTYLAHPPDRYIVLTKIEPQYKIGKYRIDFAFPKDKIAVELDGHDYHKTKEQRTNDARKDRFLILNGWTVLRFTGSEVFKDAEECSDEIREIAVALQKMKDTTIRSIQQLKGFRRIGQAIKEGYDLEITYA